MLKRLLAARFEHRSKGAFRGTVGITYFACRPEL